MRSALATVAFLFSGVSFSSSVLAVPQDYVLSFSATYPIASATLFLTDYEYGEQLTTDNVQSFTYSSVKLGTVTSSVINRVDGGFNGIWSGYPSMYTNFALNFQAEDGQSYHFGTNWESLYWRMNPIGGSGDGNSVNSNMISGSEYLWTITPVPEPESYAMMLIGLGLMGAVARRRKSEQH